MIVANGPKMLASRGTRRTAHSRHGPAFDTSHGGPRWSAPTSSLVVGMAVIVDDDRDVARATALRVLRDARLSRVAVPGEPRTPGYTDEEWTPARRASSTTSSGTASAPTSPPRHNVTSSRGRSRDPDDDDGDFVRGSICWSEFRRSIALTERIDRMSSASTLHGSTSSSVEREVDRPAIFSDEEIFEHGDGADLRARLAVPVPRDPDPEGRATSSRRRWAATTCCRCARRTARIKALLNTCAHRGNAVCRAEEGNTKAFMCTYHGWTYDLAGNLVGVPDLDQFYKGELDKSQHGLRAGRPDRQLPRVRLRARMDPTAPPLEEYLGPTGRLGIDLIASRDVEVIPGVQKFVIDCNWKFAVDNLLRLVPRADHPHVGDVVGLLAGQPPTASSTSAARRTPLGERPRHPGQRQRRALTTWSLIAEYGHAIAGPTRRGPEPDRPERPVVARDARGRARRSGPIGVDVAGHPNIFPNAWISTHGPPAVACGSRSARTRQRSGGSPSSRRTRRPEERAMSVWFCNHVFGPAGLLEQEDGENWAQATLQIRGLAQPADPAAAEDEPRHAARSSGSTGSPGSRARRASTRQLWTYHSLGAVDEGPRLGRAAQGDDSTGRALRRSR